MRKALFSAVIAAAMPFSALAAQTAMPAPSGPQCDGIAPPPTELAAWSKRSGVTAAADPQQLDKAVLTPGAAGDVVLRPTGAIRYGVTPAKPGKPDSFGGLLTFDVRDDGTYRIALGAGAWVDVVKDGAALSSTAHGHGAACTGIRKMVDFELKAGAHILQLSGSAVSSVPLLIARLR